MEKYNLPPIPVIIIEADLKEPSSSCILYYSHQVKKYIFLSKKDNKDAILYEKNPEMVIKILKYSYDPINLTFNYPTTWSDNKKDKLNKLLGSSTSGKKFKNRLRSFLNLLV